MIKQLTIILISFGLGMLLWSHTALPSKDMLERRAKSEKEHYHKGYQDGLAFMGDAFREYCTRTAKCFVDEFGKVHDAEGWEIEFEEEAEEVILDNTEFQIIRINGSVVTVCNRMNTPTTCRSYFGWY